MNEAGAFCIFLLVCVFVYFVHLPVFYALDSLGWLPPSISHLVGWLIGWAIWFAILFGIMNRQNKNAPRK